MAKINTKVLFSVDFCQSDLLFSAKRGNVLIYSFLPYDRLAKISVSLFYTLVFLHIDFLKTVRH